MFKWLGRDGHEVVFVFCAAFEDPAAYEIAEQRIQDEQGGHARVIWRPLAAVTPPLYPDGVADLAAIAPELGTSSAWPRN